jgi:hypothetical protein
VVFAKKIPQCGSGKYLFLPLKKNSLEIIMEKEDFIHCRKNLKKTQKQIAQLLATAMNRAGGPCQLMLNGSSYSSSLEPGIGIGPLSHAGC